MGRARAARDRPPRGEIGGVVTVPFNAPLSVVNVGLEGFTAAIRDAGADVVHVDWRPPAGGDVGVARANAMLLCDPRVGAANAQALAAFSAAEPVAIGVRAASTVITSLGSGARLLLHAGPPIDRTEMCGPMIGALVGAIVAEGWADSPETARVLLLDGGDVRLDSCHHHRAVGPMAGVISPSMPVWVVEDTRTGTRAFSNLNEGLGKVLRFGAQGPEVLARLEWMRSELGPALDLALGELDGLALTPLMAQALHMGDELHNRNVAASGQLLKRLAPALLGGALSSAAARRVVEFIAANDHFFLNLSMAACKLRLDAASNVAGSSVVTAMTRNGVRFGVRLSGTGDTWFEAPARHIDGLYFPGFGPDDAQADLGDSAITETAGLGGFAMAAAPAIVQFVGGTSGDAVANTRLMQQICAGANQAFSIPTMDFGAPPMGIDARLVVDRGILPIINTGIAHRREGVGQIGAGITSAPDGCFTAAVIGLATALGHEPNGPILADAATDLAAQGADRAARPT